jgi:hypothetical protein
MTAAAATDDELDWLTARCARLENTIAVAVSILANSGARGTPELEALLFLLEDALNTGAAEPAEARRRGPTDAPA